MGPGMNKFNEEAKTCMEYFAAHEDELWAVLQAVMDSPVPVRAAMFEYPGPCPAIERQVRLYNWLVRPMLAQGLEFIRVGGPSDGGYVMPDPGRGGVAYSLGIADNVSWDIDMAGRGFEIYQYDGSVDGPPVSHPSFHFEKSFIGGEPDLPKGWKSLPALLKENGHEGRDDLVLQIDIEGSEWDVFTSMGSAALRSFRQIIAELHIPPNELGLLPLRNAALRLLNISHQPVHAHINNNAPSMLLGSETLWTVIEVTYLRRDNFDFVPSTLHYPLNLDAPCNRIYTEPVAGQWGLMELLPK